MCKCQANFIVGSLDPCRRQVQVLKTKQLSIKIKNLAPQEDYAKIMRTSLSEIRISSDFTNRINKSDAERALISHPVIYGPKRKDGFVAGWQTAALAKHCFPPDTLIPVTQITSCTDADILNLIIYEILKRPMIEYRYLSAKNLASIYFALRTDFDFRKPIKDSFGYTLNQIAKILDVSVSTIKSCKSKAESSSKPKTIPTQNLIITPKEEWYD